MERDILNSRPAEQNMPKLLQGPANTIIIREIRGHNPVQDVLVIRLGSGMHLLPADGKLTAACMAHDLWNLLHGHLQQIRVQFEKFLRHIVIFVIDRLPFHGDKGVGAARDAGASQIDVALGVDGLVTQEAESSLGFGTGIVVPLLIVGVDENRVRREIVVVVHEVRQISTGFVALYGARNEESFLWLGVHAVDICFCWTRK